MQTFSSILAIIFLELCFHLQPATQDLFKSISQNKESSSKEGVISQNLLHEANHNAIRQIRATKINNKNKLSLTQPKECGLNGKSTGHVKSNGPSDTKDWPWMATLLRSKSYSNFCGGVLLNRNYVLTAAHCVSKFRTADMYIRLGEYDLFVQGETASADFSPIEIKIHPEYDPATEQHDIALLKLNASAKYSDFIRPICLPTAKAKTNQTVVVAGWGTLYYGGPLSNILMEVPVPVWDLQNCISKFTQPVFNTNLCAAAYEGGKDACQGDSGGPLLMQQTNGRWVNIGIVSWGISCGERDQPGIYTNVAAYLDWIVTNMKDAHL